MEEAGAGMKSGFRRVAAKTDRTVLVQSLPRGLGKYKDPGFKSQLNWKFTGGLSHTLAVPVC